MKLVSTPDAPQPAGHYSQAAVHNGVVYVAGQLGVDPANREGPAGDAARQTRQAMANVAAVLEAAGSGLEHVLQTTIFVSGQDLWTEVNAAYAEVMGDHRPARAIVPVGQFKDDIVLEVQVIAAVPAG